jgi:hypothetical protein
VFSPDIVAGLWTACSSDFLFVWSVQDMLRTVLVHGNYSRGKHKTFWAGQSPFLLHGAFSLEVSTSEIRCSI